jgi:pimeloyl-ACP methyl ester carboxylesterase
VRPFGAVASSPPANLPVRMNPLTKIIASIRYPESAFGKTLQRIAPILLLVLILLLGFSAFATYRIIAPDRLEETIDPSSFLLRNYLSLSFGTSDGKNLEGWFIPSVRGAPLVFLCHGYKSNRAELLTLASTFQENGYNLFVFDFRGHGTCPLRLSSLGLRETQDLLSAISTFTARPDVDPDRVGVWGVSLGAYVALSATVQSDKIKAIVVDSPFQSPGGFVEIETPSILGVDSVVFNKLAHFGFFLVNLPQVQDSDRWFGSLSLLKGRDKFFITNEETPALESQTLQVFNRCPQPKELLRLKHSKTSILYDLERKNYENTVVEFFKKRLPVRGGHSQ